MKKILLIAGTVLIITAISFALSQTVFKPKPVHYHAAFQIYNDEKLQDLSGFKYMHQMPCTVNGKPVEGHKEDEQMEKAHLHDQIGDVVHVHRNGAKWKDLFINIKYPLKKESITAYINGVKTDNFLEQKIEPYQSIVIFSGKHTDDKKYLNKSLKKEYIEKVEKRSDNCGS